MALTAGRLTEKIWVDFKNYKICYILKYSDFSPHLILVQCYYGITNFGQVFSCKAYFKVFLKCEKIKLYVVADFDTYTIPHTRAALAVQLVQFGPDHFLNFSIVNEL